MHLIRRGRRRGQRALFPLGEASGGVPVRRQSQLLFLVLELIEPVVNASLRKKFLVCSLFAETPFVKDEDTVGVLNSAQTVSNHERGPARKQAVERIPDLQL